MSKMDQSAAHERFQLILSKFKQSGWNIELAGEAAENAEQLLSFYKRWCNKHAKVNFSEEIYEYAMVLGLRKAVMLQKILVENGLDFAEAIDRGLGAELANDRDFKLAGPAFMLDLAKTLNSLGVTRGKVFSLYKPWLTGDSHGKMCPFFDLLLWFAEDENLTDQVRGWVTAQLGQDEVMFYALLDSKKLARKAQQLGISLKNRQYLLDGDDRKNDHFLEIVMRSRRRASRLWEFGFNVYQTALSYKERHGRLPGCFDEFFIVELG